MTKHTSSRNLARSSGAPSDLRDAIAGPAHELRPAIEPDTDIGDHAEPVRRGYTREVATGERRPRRAVPAGTPTITRDPSLSRAVDVAAAGGDPAARGFGSSDSDIHPGPIEPAADEQSPDAGNEPAGKWGSSGGRGN